MDQWIQYLLLLLLALYLLANCPEPCLGGGEVSNTRHVLGFFHYLCLAGLMKSKFVRRPSVVCVTIISGPNLPTSFKFQLLLPLGHTLGHFFFLNFYPHPNFEFLTIMFFLVNMGPYRSKYFKRLLLRQITAENFKTSSELSCQWSSQNYVRDF